ncbi:MAG: DUF4381 domain-containing protein [candidate division KSB1 bacterium]|nr:DUF4381 domain-containing protein [candidate division KSB1 bacterium]
MRSFSTLILILFFAFQGLVVDSTEVFAQETGEIRVSASVDQKEVPLNRQLTYTIKIEWYGELKQYDITEFENPVVTNFEIVGTASSNWVGERDGKKVAVKKYEFVLKPLELGMGYIEGVIIKYTDVTTNEEHRLITKRLEARVIEPLPEPGSYGWIVWVILLVMGVAGLGILVILWYRKRQAEKRLKEQMEAVVPLEANYLESLKSRVNLEALDDFKESFSALSRLFREYLSEKFNIKTLEVTSDEIVEALRGLNSDDKFITDTQEILQACDLVKFAGGGASKSELERVYTLVESILEKNLSLAHQGNQQEKTSLINKT